LLIIHGEIMNYSTKEPIKLLCKLIMEFFQIDKVDENTSLKKIGMSDKEKFGKFMKFLKKANPEVYILPELDLSNRFHDSSRELTFVKD